MVDTRDFKMMGRDRYGISSEGGTDVDILYWILGVVGVKSNPYASSDSSAFEQLLCLSRHW